MLAMLKNVSLFQNLTNDQLSFIGQYCSRAFIKAGTVLFREKEVGNDFFIVVSGSVKIYTATGSGEEKILSVFHNGDSFGELALIDGKPRSATAQTVEDSDLLVLSKQNFLGILSAKFDITLSIMQELCQRLRDTNQHVHDLTFLDSRTRVLKQLIQMANRNGVRNGTQISLRVVLNMDELAQVAGVQKDDLMLVILELQQKGILQVSDNGFTIDLSKLRG